MRLAKKTAVVIPGTYGVGHDAAVHFAAEGASVVIGGTEAENGRRTLEAIERARPGASAHHVPCDLFKEDDVAGVVRAAIERHGRVDAVFGCPDYYLAGLAAEQSGADLDYSLHYNCRSLFFLAKHAIPHMVERGGGSVVFLSSMYGLVSGSASCVYEVSKGTAIALARTLAERYGSSRVRVNCIVAGHVAEPPRGLKDEMPGYAIREPAEAERLAGFYPLGRLATGDDVARAAAFLASDDSAYMTGAVLALEGGFICR